MKFKNLFGILGLCWCFAADASIISIDDAVFGADSVTRDTTSELDWLDVTLTLNRSVNDVRSQLGLGGEFEGWRYATVQEFEGLLYHYTGISPGPSPSQRVEYGLETNTVDGIITLLGNTLCATGYFANCDVITKRTYGFTEYEYAPGVTFIANQSVIMDFNGSNFYGVEDYSIGNNYVTNPNFRMPELGSFLVRAMPVHEPSAIALFCLGLIGLSFTRKNNFSSILNKTSDIKTS